MENKNLRLLKIQDENGFVIDACVEYFSFSWPNWTLEFTSPVTEKLSFTETDVFECLTQLRIELARFGYKPLCAGARLDVYLSGMARDMGGGLSAQVLGLGDQEDVKIVHIFDYAEPELIASVEEQFKYYASIMSPAYELKILDNGASIVEGIIYENRFLEPNKIKFTSSATPDIQAGGSNMFECLNDLRIKLEKYGYRPLCNGARLDTYILPTDLDDDGEWLHVLVPGKTPSGLISNSLDLVETFGDAEPDLVTSIAEQRKNYESWLDSIKHIPLSEYQEYDLLNLPDLYFRLVAIGELPLMWLFDIDPSTVQYTDQVGNSDDLERLRALSPLSPQEVEQIGSLNGEAILGFISGEMLNLEYFRPNKVFKDFVQSVIACEAPKDDGIVAAALEQQEGWLYIIDNRVADLDQKEISPGDILGAFKITDGLIVVNSYKPNENYSLFGDNGLMQLPTSLHVALIKALKEVEGD
jgi:hypothetical protein